MIKHTVLLAVAIQSLILATAAFAAPADRDTFRFIWVPNSSNGTISKVDIRTGAELGRYLTGPSANGNPSRTTVDLKGNCWVGNRDTGTVVKVGLAETGQCVDRNGNGIIETSSGVTPLKWGEDECVLLEVVLDKGKEATYLPGEYKGAHNSSLPRGIAIDSNNNLWVGTYNTMMYYSIKGATGYISNRFEVSALNHKPYGAVIDSRGILWSADPTTGNLLRLDTSSGETRVIRPGHMAYGLGLDMDGHLFVSGWTDNKLSRIDTLTGKVEWTVNTGDSGSRGIAVTGDGDVWVVNSNSNTVSRWSSDGTKKATISGFSQPTGAAVDSAGKVWVVNFNNADIYRIDPATNQRELTTSIGGSGHYGYSDMTGTVIRRVKAGDNESDRGRGDGNVDKLFIKGKGGKPSDADIGSGTGTRPRSVSEKPEAMTPEQKRQNSIRKKLGFDAE